MGQTAECIGGEFLMADYLITDTELTSIADAIREKGGTTEQLMFPDGFISAVESIQSGGGGGAKEPYIEETYDANGNLIGVNLVGYTTIRPYAFQGCTSLALTSLPSGLTSIGDNVFQGCTRLALTSLPSGITSIGYNAFYNCTSLALTSLPSGLTSIGINAFRNCTGLASITFNGKPGSIDSTAFNSCTNLKTINVPWASGEVANAPWGATKATINYNYTG